MIIFKTTSFFRERLQALVMSKANGYRLIYMVSMVEERVAFLDIYPKRGPLQQLDIPNEELYRLLAQYVEEGCRNELLDFH